MLSFRWLRHCRYGSCAHRAIPMPRHHSHIRTSNTNVLFRSYSYLVLL